MKAYLLTINPRYWSWPDFDNVVNKTREGNYRFSEPWACANTGVRKGDRIFLMRQGDEKRGIMASGHAKSESYKRVPDYQFDNGENRGIATPHIDVEFDWIIDPAKDNLLSQEELKENISGQEWAPRQSGIEIIGESFKKIEIMWAKHIGVEHDVFNLLKIMDEINPDEHDGSYELVRETVKSYSNTDLTKVTFNDLNLLYLMAVIQTNKERNQNLINESNLPQFEKARLTGIFNRVWEKANQNKYKNIAKPPTSVGMFGTGFYSFDKTSTDRDLPQKIIGTFVKIISIDDLDEIYKQIHYDFDQKLNGIAVASFSVMAHCFKPEVFPIMNKNEGFGNVFSLLGIEFEKPKSISDYLKASKEIRDFRDKNFSFKNYKVMDEVARMIEQESPQMNTFIVFQANFDTERNGGYIQAPLKSESGNTPFHWDKLRQVKKGDIIFHMASSQIKAVSLAKGGQYVVPGNSNLRRVDCEYILIPNSLNLFFYRDKIIEISKNIDMYSPFNKNGTGNQGYLFDLNINLARLFAAGILKDNPDIKADYLRGLIDNTHKGTESEEDENQMEKEKEMKLELNTILYGPPGTGKTYNTKKYAVAICLDYTLSEVEEMSYDVIEDFYKTLVKEKKVVFTTFHQSYGYEDFIEGIKPSVSEDDPEDKNVYYNVGPGVFKKFCEEATTIQKKQLGKLVIDENRTIWQMSLYNDKIRQECFEEGYLRIGFNDLQEPGMNGFNQMKNGDIVLSFHTNHQINGIAIIDENEIYQLNGKTEFKFARKVKWIVKDLVLDIKAINGGLQMPRETCTRLPYFNRQGLSDLINKYSKDSCVFIIDEINRGNISKIFGELITLIEPTKRIGEEEETLVQLPYSKTLFGVPNNVYILGTMNTADRSIALLDTALRRRFNFIEMMPDSSVLESIGAKSITDNRQTLDVIKMLDTINDRIEVLYDREHTIGHAFFTSFANNPSLNNLQGIFENKIIPLLQEYFYEDYEKIQLVLADNDKKEDKFKFVLAINNNPQNIFKGIKDYSNIPEKRYSINKEAFKHIESYIQIY